MIIFLARDIYLSKLTADAEEFDRRVFTRALSFLHLSNSPKSDVALPSIFLPTCLVDLVFATAPWSRRMYHGEVLSTSLYNFRAPPPQLIQPTCPSLVRPTLSLLSK